MMKKIILFFALMIIGASSGLTQTSPYWGELKKGGYAVGYKTYTKKDYARATRPKIDFRGKPFEGERARTIVFSVWYPATSGKDAKLMSVEDYSFVASPTPLTDEQKNQFRTRFKAPRLANKISEAKLDELLTMPTEAVFNASPVNQKFPLFIGYGVGRSLGEFLASHGYVVASVSSNQTESQPFDVIATMEFGLNELQQYPNVDFSKIAATGFSFGGGMATLLQMKTNNIDAVVSFDGVEAWTQATRQLLPLPFFDPEAANVPYLRFHDSESGAVTTGNSGAQVDFSVFYDRAVFMNYTQINYKELGHRSSESAILNHLIPNYDGTNPKNSLQYHRLMSEYTLYFLDANLKKDEKAAVFLKRSPEENGYAKDLVTIKRKEAVSRPPSPVEAAEVIDREGIEAFLKINQDLKKSLPKPFAAQMLTNLMVQNVFRNQPKNVTALANLLVETHPDLCSSWFTAAYNLQRMGDTATAIRYYEKFLEVEKNDNVTTVAEKDRMRRLTLENLADLKKKTS